MPEIKHYEVEQIRRVKVQANNVVDAARIAAAAFDNGQNSGNGVINGPEGIWGNTSSKIEVTNLNVFKEL
jgi:hypothetical protein